VRSVAIRADARRSNHAAIGPITPAPFLAEGLHLGRLLVNGMTTETERIRLGASEQHIRLGHQHLVFHVQAGLAVAVDAQDVFDLVLVADLLLGQELMAHQAKPVVGGPIDRRDHCHGLRGVSSGIVRLVFAAANENSGRESGQQPGRCILPGHRSSPRPAPSRTGRSLNPSSTSRGTIRSRPTRGASDSRAAGWPSRRSSSVPATAARPGSGRPGREAARLARRCPPRTSWSARARRR